MAWGTDGIDSGVIVISLRAKLMTEVVDIPNGSGIIATIIMLNNGTEIEIDVVDDRSLTFPDWGTTITLINPRETGATGTSTLLQVMDNNYNAERKQEGRRTLLCRKYVLITPS